VPDVQSKEFGTGGRCAELLLMPLGYHVNSRANNILSVISMPHTVSHSCLSIVHVGNAGIDIVFRTILILLDTFLEQSA